MATYKIKRFSLFGNFFKKKPDFSDHIKSNYKWALDFIEKIDRYIEIEEKKLIKLNEEIAPYIMIKELGNSITNLTDFIANFNNNKYWVSEIPPKYIKYDPETDKLLLRKGYPIQAYIDHSKDPIISEVKNKFDLVKIYKQHFQDLQKSIPSLDDFIGILTGNDEEEIDMMGGFHSIKQYYTELNKSLKNILLKIN